MCIVRSRSGANRFTSIGQIREQSFTKRCERTWNYTHIDYIPGSTYVAFDRANDRQTEAMTEEVTIPELEPLGPVTAKGPQHARVCVEFINNNSKQWDGKQIWLESEWIEELYSLEELTPGATLTLPWPGRGGKNKNCRTFYCEKKRTRFAVLYI